MRPAADPPGRAPGLGAEPAEGTGTVAQMRRALGRQLAAKRNRTGLSQWELAPLTGYSRSTLSDAELGRHRPRREFWLRCDELLRADGRLVASYDRIEAGQPAGREPAGSPAATQACPHCRRPIAVLVVPAAPGQPS